MIDLMTLLQAILQGLLEWLPVSSSGFVSLIGILMGEPIQESLDTALALHLASGVAAFILVRNDIYKLAKDIPNIIKGSFNPILLAYIIGFASSLLIAYSIYSFITGFITNTSLALILIGAFLIVTSIITRIQTSGNKNVSPVDIFVLFLLQGIAVTPGLSRSGLVLAYLGFRRIKPREAFRTNLLVAVPVLITAGVYGLYNSMKVADPLELVVGESIVFIISLIVGGLLLKLFRRISTWVFTLIIGLLLVLSGISVFLR